MTTRSLIALASATLAFGKIDRITYHEDGVTPESDSDHTVMLGVIACAFAARHFRDLDLGKIAQYALVHDLVEIYAGDTPTLRIDADGRAAKAERERQALELIRDEFATLPWLYITIADYEERRDPEARFVKALDKLLPKITHILNHGVTLRDQGMSRKELVTRYDEQKIELESYASDFPQLLQFREDLLKMLFEKAAL